MLHAAGLFNLRRFFRFPPPAPSRARTLCEEGAALAREGEYYSIHLISKGAVAPFVSPTGESTPPNPLLRGGASPPSHPPRVRLARVRCLNLCFMKAGLASLYGGAGAQWAPFCADRAGRRDGGPAEPGRKGLLLWRFPPPYPLPRTNSLRRGGRSGAGGEK